MKDRLPMLVLGMVLMACLTWEVFQGQDSQRETLNLSEMSETRLRGSYLQEFEELAFDWRVESENLLRFEMRTDQRTFSGRVISPDGGKSLVFEGYPLTDQEARLLFGLAEALKAHNASVTSHANSAIDRALGVLSYWVMRNGTGS